MKKRYVVLMITMVALQMVFMGRFMGGGNPTDTCGKAHNDSNCVLRSRDDRCELPEPHKSWPRNILTCEQTTKGVTLKRLNFTKDLALTVEYNIAVYNESVIHTLLMLQP